MNNLKELKAAMEPFSHGKPGATLDEYILAEKLSHPINVLKLIEIVEIQKEALEQIRTPGGRRDNSPSAKIIAKEALYQATSIAETII